MGKDLISIIVPVFNVEKYLSQCVKSILEQSYCGEIEVLLIDDGSTDSSGLMCDKLSKEDDRIKVFHKVNGGLSDARNFGIKKSQGSILCFVDSDDFLHKDYLQELYSIKKKNNAEISECACFKYLESSPMLCKDIRNKTKILRSKEWLTESGVGDFLSVVAWNKLYDRDLFNDVEYPIGRNFEDESTTYKVIYKSKCIARTYKKLYYYRQREGSITQNTLTAKSLTQKLLALSEKCDFFINRNEKDIVSYCQAKYSILIISKFDVCNDVLENKNKQKEFYNDVRKRYIDWIKPAKNVPLKYKLYIWLFLVKNRRFESRYGE